MQKEISTIRKALIWGGEVSLAVLDTTALVNEAISRHGLSPVAAAALGRTLTATAYLCSWLKDEESSLSVSISGGGAGGKISTAGDGALRIRGFIEHPEVDLPLRGDGKLDVGGCVGKNGTVTVIRDDGEGIPFVGTCELVSGEIAEDFSAYFLISEQRPTAIALGVRIAGGICVGAGGVFLQPLPGSSEETLARVEACIADFSHVSALIGEKGAAAIAEGFGAADCAVREVSFCCHCSAERAGQAVLAMGREDAFALLRERGEVAVHCHYCNTDYKFGEKELAALFCGGKK